MKKKIAVSLPALLAVLGTALAENAGTFTNDMQVTETLEVSGGNFLESVGVRLAIAAVVALIVALVRVNAMKAKLLTAHSRSGAADYVQKGSFELGLSQDHFLYERTERRRIQTAQSSSGGGSSGGGGNTRGGGANRIR